MLDMGFRPAVDRIVAPGPRKTARRSSSRRRSTARSAASPRAYTTRRAPPRAGRAGRADGATSSTASSRVQHEHKLDELVAELRRNDRGRTLVFVRTKRGADRLVKRLKARDVDAVAMHGEQDPGPARARAGRASSTGRVDTLVATDVAARGLDVDDITHVINFDAPEDREGYVHRVGRTGRAGRTGIGITFVIGRPGLRRGQHRPRAALHDEFGRTGFSVSPPNGRNHNHHPGNNRPTATRSGGRNRRRRSGRR